MTDPFTSRMAELDAIVEQCRGADVFATGIVRDISNHSNRDWPRWGIEIEQTDEDGLEKRRRTAAITLNAPAPGVPSVFEGHWSARIWSGVSTDRVTERGDCTFPWDTPSAQQLASALVGLLDEADEAISGATGPTD